MEANTFLLLVSKHTCWWKKVFYKYEDGLLRVEFDPLSNDIDELSNCKVSRDKVPGKVGKAIRSFVMVRAYWSLCMCYSIKGRYQSKIYNIKLCLVVMF